MRNQGLSGYKKKNFLNTSQPNWLLEYELNPTSSLNVSEVYSVAEYWDVDIMNCDPGMPLFHRHWLMDLLERTDTITELNLEKCNIGDFGLEELGEILKHNTTIRKLNLKDNNISANKALKFVNMMEEYNFTLCDLEMNEGDKDVIEKSKNQFLSFNLDTISQMVQASEPDKDVFLYIGRKISAFNKFNTKVTKVGCP